jgi:hypothetical protein
LASSQVACVPAQTPPAQVSPVVHAFPSEHAAVLFVCSHPPVLGSQLSVVHGLPSLQLNPVPGRHAPNAHTSPDVQPFPSSQAFELLLKTHPVIVLQLSVVHALASSHTCGAPEHEPLEHVSPVVQASPSLHTLVLFANTQPTAGLQLSFVQTLLSPQTFGPPGWHDPPEQTSPIVQAFPSEQAIALFACAQTPVDGSQLSLVQTLPSSQPSGVPARHVPIPQASPTVQAFPSSQAFVLLTKTQPVAGLQLSVVHEFPSSHAAGVPTHEPLLQVSPEVQAFRSEHALELST